MSTVAPQAIWDCWDAIHAGIPSAQLSGIVGDPAHTYGYHLSRQDCSSGDYSVQLSRDLQGPSNYAAALDVNLDPGLMKTVTNRLLKAAKNRDPRMNAVRSFCGTTNGTVTHSYDCSNGHEGYGEWDDSHLWHTHISFYRDSTTNSAALRQVADVYVGAGSSGGTAEEDDVPDRMQLKRSGNVKLSGGAVAELRFDTEDWDTGNLFLGTGQPSPSNMAALAKIGQSAVTSYVSTFTCIVDGLAAGKQVLTALGFVDLASGATTAQMGWTEWTSNGGLTYIADTRVGRAGKGKGVKVRIKPDTDVTIKSAVWSVLSW